jgi:drug/metabolite transporter (DMT)-like permease
MAAALLLPFLPWTAHGASLDPAVAGSVLGLALLSTAVAYIIYFHLIDTVGPTQAATVTFVSPMAGILGGAALLGEPVGPGLIAGLALIFLGIPLSARELPTFWPFRRRGTS